MPLITATRCSNQTLPFSKTPSFSSRPPYLSLLADQSTSMDRLKQIHAQMVVSGSISDNSAAGRIISFSALSDSGDIAYARNLFDNTQEPNSFM